MKIVNKKIEELIPYENNPRLNDDTIILVENSIKEFGFKVPIVIDKNNVIVAGHTRYRASQRLGLEEIPCIIADDLTDEQIKAFRLADNKVAQKSEWDFDLLDLELNDIKNIDMTDFDFFDKTVVDDKKTEKEKIIDKMEIKAFEHYDYLVFVFTNQMDWLNIVNEFDIKKVNAGYGKTKKVGVGRVINGKRLLEKLGHKNIDIEQRKMEHDNNS